jgi:hypothetical protein
VGQRVVADIYETPREPAAYPKENSVFKPATQREPAAPIYQDVLRPSYDKHVVNLARPQRQQAPDQNYRKFARPRDVRYSAKSGQNLLVAFDISVAGMRELSKSNDRLCIGPKRHLSPFLAWLAEAFARNAIPSILMMLRRNSIAFCRAGINFLFIRIGSI